jgi:hypothetical protein
VDTALVILMDTAVETLLDIAVETLMDTNVVILLDIAVETLLDIAVETLMDTNVVILLATVGDMTLEKLRGVRVFSQWTMEFGTIWCHGVPITARSKADITLPGLIANNQCSYKNY